jgi:hypothetical protein
MIGIVVRPGYPPDVEAAPEVVRAGCCNLLKVMAAFVEDLGERRIAVAHIRFTRMPDDMAFFS